MKKAGSAAYPMTQSHSASSSPRTPKRVALLRLVAIDMRLVDTEQGRERGERQEQGCGGERRPQCDIRQEAAGCQAEQPARQQRQLLCARRLCPLAAPEQLGNECAMSRRDRVQADVDGCSEGGEREIVDEAPRATAASPPAARRLPPRTNG